MGYYDYGYYDYYEEAAVGTGFFAAFAGVYLVMIFFALAISLVSYIFQSWGFYSIANRRGIQNAWLAWVPLGNLWILGSISDQYQYVTKGQVKNRRKLLLGLYIGIFVCYIAIIIGTVMISVLGFSDFDGEGVIALVAPILLGTLVIMAVAIAGLVINYMCLYDLYRSCDPNNGMLFLLLSIFVSGLTPFLVFICRNKEAGMPPRIL